MLQSVASRGSQQSGGGGSVSGCAEELEDLRAQLREERAHRREIEREMEMQVGPSGRADGAGTQSEADCDGRVVWGACANAQQPLGINGVVAGSSPVAAWSRGPCPPPGVIGDCLI